VEVCGWAIKIGGFLMEDFTMLCHTNI